MSQGFSAASPIEEIAARVCAAIEAHGISAVLSGGAVVTIYTVNEYQSHDLDFITSESLAKLATAMASIGFVRERGRHFVHPDTLFTVEFPPGPLMVGDQPVEQYQTLQTSYGAIRLLTPTDSVKDRLAAFFHWNDRQGLEQAVAICRRHPFDRADLQRWARAERQMEKLQVFEAYLAAASG